MTTKIEAHERNIGDIFSDLYQFEIPPYQRPYATGKRIRSANFSPTF